MPRLGAAAAVLGSVMMLCLSGVDAASAGSAPAGSAPAGSAPAAPTLHMPSFMSDNMV